MKYLESISHDFAVAKVRQFTGMRGSSVAVCGLCWHRSSPQPACPPQTAKNVNMQLKIDLEQQIKTSKRHSNVSDSMFSLEDLLEVHKWATAAPLFVQGRSALPSCPAVRAVAGNRHAPRFRCCTCKTMCERRSWVRGAGVEQSRAPAPPCNAVKSPKRPCLQQDDACMCVCVCAMRRRP